MCVRAAGTTTTPADGDHARTSGTGEPVPVTERTPGVRGRVLAVVVTVLATLGGPPGQGAPDHALSALTFNIHHAAGPDGVVDVDRVAAEIAASGAEVVGLQEVDRRWGERTGFADQPAQLADRLGMQVVFAPNDVVDGPVPRQYGTAILTRLPIRSSSHTLLPKGGEREEQRGLLEAVVDVRGVAVRVMSVHLESGSAASRLLQARVVARHVERSAEPVLLLGDLNGTPDSPEVTALTALLADSHAGGDGYTHPAQAPTERIDFVLADGRFVHSEVRPTAASDHRPLFAAVVIGSPVPS
jgi:endonuclease/exonuclease/phosphatase family metal-dependent hydrolase